MIWLRAETAEVLAADLRALAADCGIGGVRGEERGGGGRGALAPPRTRGAWLLVFDNVASRELLEAHLPRGCRGAGHVLVTTRELVERSSPSLIASHRTSRWSSSAAPAAMPSTSTSR